MKTWKKILIGAATVLGTIAAFAVVIAKRAQIESDAAAIASNHGETLDEIRARDAELAKAAIIHVQTATKDEIIERFRKAFGGDA